MADAAAAASAVDVPIQPRKRRVASLSSSAGDTASSTRQRQPTACGAMQICVYNQRERAYTLECSVTAAGALHMGLEAEFARIYRRVESLLGDDSDEYPKLLDVLRLMWASGEVLEEYVGQEAHMRRAYANVCAQFDRERVAFHGIMGTYADECPESVLADAEKRHRPYFDEPDIGPPARGGAMTLCDWRVVVYDTYDDAAAASSVVTKSPLNIKTQKHYCFAWAAAATRSPASLSACACVGSLAVRLSVAAVVWHATNATYA